MKKVSFNIQIVLSLVLLLIISSCQQTEVLENVDADLNQALRDSPVCNTDQTIGIHHNEILDYIFSFGAEIESMNNDFEALKSFAYQKMSEHVVNLGYDPAYILSEQEISSFFSETGNYSDLIDSDVFTDEERNVWVTLFTSNPVLDTQEGLDEFLSVVSNLDCIAQDLGSPNQQNILQALSVARNSATYWNGVASTYVEKKEIPWGDVALADVGGAGLGASAGSIGLFPGILIGALSGAAWCSATAYLWHDLDPV